ncbi:WG repeat-containing protein [Anthocerotibacter panamensis]|uniref:WG repeat-containing protein n=1 Tax=Anthocerotibacter panamensis TaxID=2857077 RepID=UPI001C405E91|nr:WG repeat-containing protein [Anthocerotibacter panamensis]
MANSRIKKSLLTYWFSILFCLSIALVLGSAPVYAKEVIVKYGFIDRTGKLVIPAIYDRVEKFSEGLAVVKIGNKYGYIDRTGKLVIPVKFNDAHAFKEGLAQVTISDSGEDSHKQFINKQGESVILTKNGFELSGDFNEGIATVEYKSGGYGYIDKMGELITSTIFEDVTDFKEGLAKVMGGGDDWSLKKFGYIDKKGKSVIPEKFVDAASFNEGLAWVDLTSAESKFIEEGFINRQGEIIIRLPLKLSARGRGGCEAGYAFYEGLALISQQRIRNAEDPYLYDKYNFYHPYDTETGTQHKAGFIDKRGKIVVPLKFDYACKFKKGIALVCPHVYASKTGSKANFDDRCGLLDKKGLYLVKPGRFTDITNFNEGLAVIRSKNKKYGYINEEGKLVIPAQFEKAYSFSESLAPVQLTKGGPNGYIDKAGKLVISYQFDKAYNFFDGLAIVGIRK